MPNVWMGPGSDGELPRVLADQSRILQVFSNLGGNAVKFTPKGGRITYESPELPAPPSSGLRAAYAGGSSR